MRFVFAIAVLGLISLAQADDGILYFHGNPRLLKGDTQIRMVQEFVRAKIGESTARVYCRFVFHNDGPATVARIGFPDGNDHDGEKRAKNPKPSLTLFRSCVDGKPTATTLQKTDLDKNTPYAFFHVKKLRFGKGQTRIVEDWYESPLNDGATATDGYYVRGFHYTMASGGSWKGNIGRATIQVDFEPKSLHKPHPFSDESIDWPNEFTKWNRVPKNQVFWSGFAEPVRIGNSLIFIEKNFKPDEDSDIELGFGARKIQS